MVEHMEVFWESSVTEHFFFSVKDRPGEGEHSTDNVESGGFGSASKEQEGVGGLEKDTPAPATGMDSSGGESFNTDVSDTRRHEGNEASGETWGWVD